MIAQRDMVTTDTIQNQPNDGNTAPKRPRWNNNNKTIFIQNINKDNMNEINYSLKSYSSSNRNYITQLSLDSIVTDIGHIFKEAAVKADFIRPKSSFKKEPHTTHVKPKKEPWFDNKEKRKNFFSARQMYNKDKTLENYKVMKNNSIQYKKQLAISKCNYQNTICVNLRQLKSKSSKQFWDLLNKSTSLTQSKVLCIPYEKLYIHFQKLFSDPNTSNILPSACHFIYTRFQNQLNYLKSTKLQVKMN